MEKRKQPQPNLCVSRNNLEQKTLIKSKIAIFDLLKKNGYEYDRTIKKEFNFKN